MKKKIETYLRSEETISNITIMRTQYNHILSEFYFFKIFIDILEQDGYRIYIKQNTVLEPIDINLSDDNRNRIKTISTITLEKDSEIMEKTFNSKTFYHTAISGFNFKQGDMGMRESTNALIDIFLSLLK